MTLRRLGIIPAAGKATRFGGITKELLPCKTGRSFLCEAIYRLDQCDAIVLVTNTEKIAEHAREAERACSAVPVFLATQRYNRDIFGAIRTALDIPADEYYFTMPDTYMRPRPFPNHRNHDFEMGVFDTLHPERYGCIVDGKVINKQRIEELPVKAWGVLAFSVECATLWMKNGMTDYTEAINLAIEWYGLHTWDIGEYFDNASFEDYRGWL